MSDPAHLDSAWIAANPLPVHGAGTTKNSRGHVVIVGGACAVPGAPRLCAEAAFRAGAGKVQVATVASAAVPLGVLLPEAGMIALPEDDDGEIAVRATTSFRKALDRCGVVLVGPGMGSPAAATACVRSVSDIAPNATLILDAAAIACLKDPPDGRLGTDRPVILTPNFDEMALLLDWTVARIANGPGEAAREAARRHHATVVLKGDDSFIADIDGDVLHYLGGGVGLATGGSGDVLAGVIAGLIARGAAPVPAAGWGVWLHGHAARRLAADPGPIGFLARELPARFPRLLPQ